MKSTANKQYSIKKDGCSSELLACPRCDSLVLRPQVLPGRYLTCDRCGSPISKNSSDRLNRVFIFSLIGFLLYLPALFLPLLTVSSIGFKEKGNVVQTAIHLFQSGYYFVSIMVFCTAILFPFLKLLLPCTLSLCLKLNRTNRLLGPGLKILKYIDKWGMVEVYLLGILVTLIKMNGMAHISYNPGFFCFIGLVIITTITMVSLDYSLFWQLLSSNPLPENNRSIIDMMRKNPGKRWTGRELNLGRCHQCSLLVSLSDANPSICPRCSSLVHQRIPGSIIKTWFLVIVSFMLFIPANMLPIIQVDFLGIIPLKATIMGGIISFFQKGEYGTGLLVFTASILVPLLKICGLANNLIAIHFKNCRFLKQNTTIFRCIRFIGHWSMLDIFVISLLTVLADFGLLSSIHTAPAATYFCIVVVCTMIATLSFDSRIMWDRCLPNADSTGSEPEK